ncbi:MAG: CBS domain-containing protein [Balneolales bacterium]|nr:CBS domain-containing protein [Balneolales bacterium]
MFVKELLNSKLLPLRASDTVRMGLDAMKALKTDALPVIDFTTAMPLGVVTFALLEAEKDKQQTIFSLADRQLILIPEDTHIVDAARNFPEFSNNMIVVTDQDHRFAGVLLASDLIHAVASLFNADDHGAVIMIEMEPKDFSLFEIVRLVEYEGVKILGIGVQRPSECNTFFRVTIKLNVADIDSVLHVLNRYGYTITSKTQAAANEYDLHDRADEFMRFLDI